MSAEDKNWADKSYSRRRFLANAAKLAGAALAYPLLSTPLAGSAASDKPTGAGPKGTRKVAVLLPSSTSYPGVAASFLAGMSVYLRSADRQDVNLVGTEVGSGSALVRQKVESMLQAERVNVIAGIVGPSVAASLAPLLEASKTLFVSATLGENAPRAAERSSHIFYHTLGLWQSNWALGRWAAGNLGRSALVASSFRDSGYDALHAFRLGFESAGGQVLATEITHRPEDSAGVSRLMSRIQKTRPNLVFASYYGQDAVELLSAYSKDGLAGAVPLVGTAYLTDAPVLAKAGHAALGVRTGFSWSPALSTPENASFINGYGNEAGAPADGFSLLGYETARLVVEVLDQSTARSKSLSDALSSARFEGPRGLVSMDSRTHSTSGPLYLREVRSEGGILTNAVIGKLESSAEQDSQLDALVSSERTGWLNPYLCD